MNQEKWAEIAKELENPFGKVRLKIDEYDVTIIVAQEKTLKYCLAVYINDKIKVKDIIEDCDIRRKFYQEHKTSLLKRKDLERLKREKKSVREEVKKKYTSYYYDPCWRSFRSLKAHLIKNNEDIEVIKIG